MWNWSYGTLSVLSLMYEGSRRREHDTRTYSIAFQDAMVRLVGTSISTNLLFVSQPSFGLPVDDRSNGVLLYAVTKKVSVRRSWPLPARSRDIVVFFGLGGGGGFPSHRGFLGVGVYCLMRNVGFARGNFFFSPNDGSSVQAGAR